MKFHIVMEVSDEFHAAMLTGTPERAAIAMIAQDAARTALIAMTRNMPKDKGKELRSQVMDTLWNRHVPDDVVCGDTERPIDDRLTQYWVGNGE